eukprot:snap_masked-scaffold_1-processed-gene-10.13-mRNA-1 protein AED:0.21 eAED:0.25 QI:0/-1/0/1/-1/1/1/0/184
MEPNEDYAEKQELTKTLDKTEIIEQLIEIRKNVRKFDFLLNLEDRSPLSAEVWAGMLTVLAIVLTLISFNIKFLGIFTTNLLGISYPVYRSLKAIESPQKDDDTKWLTYWTVFGGFFVLETSVLQPDSVFSGAARGYFLIKMLFLGWCQFLNGSQFLYSNILKPSVKIMHQWEAQLDARLKELE